MVDSALLSSAGRTFRQETACEVGGTLILVVGPSGSGKDTLIGEARKHFAQEPKAVFCERTITRSGDIGEKHRCVTEAEFERLAVSGGFFLHWNAHDLRYGIPAAMMGALEAGCTVIANVSRRTISEARYKWPATRIVNVTASREVLRERLAARGRESVEAIEHRLEQAFSAELPCDAHIYEIDNSGVLEPAVKLMIGIITSALNDS